MIWELAEEVIPAKCKLWEISSQAVFSAKNNRGMVAHAAIIWCDVLFLALPTSRLPATWFPASVHSRFSCSSSAPPSVARGFTFQFPCGPWSGCITDRRLLPDQSTDALPGAALLAPALSGFQCRAAEGFVPGFRHRHPTASRPPSFSLQLSPQTAQRSFVPSRFPWSCDQASGGSFADRT